MPHLDTNNIDLLYFEPDIADFPDGYLGGDLGGRIDPRSGETVRHIVLHYTAGWSAHHVTSTWSGSIGVPFVVEGNFSGIQRDADGRMYGGYDDSRPHGRIYRLYEDHRDHFTRHIGDERLSDTVNLRMHRRSLGIEIVNLGHVSEQDGSFFFGEAGSGKPLRLSPGTFDVHTYDDPIRNHLHYHKITDRQLISLYNLLVWLCFDLGVPLRAWPETIHVYDAKWHALETEGGILSHCNFSMPNSSGKYRKWDWHPQPELVAMLQRINALGRARAQLNELRDALLSAPGGLPVSGRRQNVVDLMEAAIHHYLVTAAVAGPVPVSYPIREGRQEMPNFNRSWASWRSEFAHLSLLDRLYFDVLEPYVKPKYREYIADRLFRIFGELDAAGYREYFQRNGTALTD